LPALVTEQYEQCMGLCERRGYVIVSIAIDPPGQTAAWDDARLMVQQGRAERVIVSSASSVPDYLESATGTLPGPGRVQPAAPAGRYRRTRLIRRADGGA
jgi:hypothetical protein